MMEANDKLIDLESYQMMKSVGNFDIAPCEGTFDFEDKSRFTKMELSSAQKMYMSSFLQQVPMATTAGTLVNAYTASFPEGLPHTLTALKQGGFGSMVRENGKFAGSASFYQMTEQAAVLGAFSAMSIATGQYFLTQINSELHMINLKIDKILEFLYGEKKAELMAEISFVKYAYQNYGSIMAHEPQQIATIGSLQEAKKIAMKDIEFYMNDLDLTVNEEAKKYTDFDALANKAFQIRESLELSMQLYIMSSMMEVYFSQNQDNSYMHSLETDMTAYLDKCEKRMLSSFSVLNRRMVDYKAKPMEKIDKSVHTEKIGRLIDSLNSGEESTMRKSLRTALHAATRKSEYYLAADGNMYAKVV